MELGIFLFVCLFAIGLEIWFDRITRELRDIKGLLKSWLEEEKRK